MHAFEVAQDIYRVGAVAWDLRDLHGCATERGTSYNALLLEGDTNVLADTVKASSIDQLLANIRSVIMSNACESGAHRVGFAAMGAGTCGQHGSRVGNQV